MSAEYFFSSDGFSAFLVPDFMNRGSQIGLRDPGLFCLGTGLAEKNLELFQSRGRNALENHSVTLADNNKLIAFMEAESPADFFWDDDLSFG